jgi:hypothetical protein
MERATILRVQGGQAEAEDSINIVLNHYKMIFAEYFEN